MPLFLSRLKKQSNILWLDLGDLGDLVNPAGPHEQWQDHGLGLLRTILHQNGVHDRPGLHPRRHVVGAVAPQMQGYDMLIMNVRSYTFPVAYRAAKIFKEVNPNGLVLTGGMHATVALDEMEAIPEFDHICRARARTSSSTWSSDPAAFPRVILGEGAKSMAEWPMIDRTLWPKPAGWRTARKWKLNWPLEPECGWGPGPVATLLTSRVCPWQCVFCNENSYIPNMGRRPVEHGDRRTQLPGRKYGVGSVVIHDSMFFQNPKWLKEWIEKYPRKTQALALLGRRPRRHGAPVAGPVRGAGQGDQLEHRLDRLRVGQRPRAEAAQQGVHRRRQLLRHRPAQPDRRRTGAPRASGRRCSGRTSCWASRARAARTPSRRCAWSST